jgi:predicted HTH transcriptional regulator
MELTLDEWTYELILKLIDTPIVESETVDFKRALPEADTLTDLCCSFANSKGGFIVFGINQKSSFFIEGMDYDTEFARYFGDKLRAIPAIDYPAPKFVKIPNSSKYLIVVYIPRSKSGPHVHRDLQKMRFLKRTSKGKELMTLSEIQEAFERELRAKLDILTDMLSKSYLEEKKRREKHKAYFTRRILAHYERLVEQYNRFNKDLSDTLNDENDVNKLRVLQISIENLINTLDSFWFVAEGDFKDIQEFIDNPRLRDKFVFIIGTAISFVKSSLNRTLSTHGYYYNRESYETWMGAIEEHINLLKEEVKDIV